MIIQVIFCEIRIEGAVIVIDDCGILKKMHVALRSFMGFNSFGWLFLLHFCCSSEFFLLFARWPFAVAMDGRNIYLHCHLWLQIKTKAFDVDDLAPCAHSRWEIKLVKVLYLAHVIQIGYCLSCPCSLCMMWLLAWLFSGMSQRPVCRHFVPVSTGFHLNAMANSLSLMVTWHTALYICIRKSNEWLFIPMWEFRSHFQWLWIAVVDI